MDMKYDLKSTKRGLVYIIVNERFTAEGYPNRIGAYTDYKNMKKLFKPLNLKLMTYYDKTAEEIKSILRSASNKPDLAERACFICIISSHGEQWTEVDQRRNKRTMEHAIVGVDGKRVLTKDLVELFSEEKCRDLNGKPKLFFIQACRETIYSKDRSQALDAGVGVQYIVSAKLSKHHRLRQRLSTRSYYDNADSKPDDSGVPIDALDQIIGSLDIDKDKDEDKDEEEDEEFSDGYDTATTDEDSEADSDRETGHEDIKKRDRSQYKDQKKDIAPESDLSIHIEAVTPTDQNKDVTESNEITQQQERLEDGPKDQADAGGRKGTRRKVITDIPVAEVVEVTAIPCHDDMLVMFASPPGKLAWRSTTEGGWLLANLYNVFKQYIRSREISNRDFLSILVEVSQEVSHKETVTDDPNYNGLKMVPTIYHRLTKDVVMCAEKNTGLLRKLAEKVSEIITK